MAPVEVTDEVNTTAWTVQVWLSFLLAMLMTALGILFLPVDAWVQGYMGMAQVFLVGSTFTLAKTVRDNHEARRLRNRISQAKTDKILREFEEPKQA
jgi:hypothetical protein